MGGMRELSIRVLAGACFAALLVAAVPAQAEFAPDGGFDVGANGKFQPGIRFLASFQSNVYRSESDAEGDITLRLEPHLKLLLRSENANFDLWSVYYLKKYTDAFVDHAYDPVGHRDLDIFLNYDLGFDLETRPEGKVSFLLYDKFERKSTEFDNTSIPSTTEGTEESARFHQYSLMDRLGNDARIGVAVRPGSSLEIEGLFHFDVDKYSGATEQGISSEAAERRTYGVSWDLYGSVNVRWRFFPKTSLLFSSDFGHMMWNPDLQESLGGSMDDSLTNLNQYDNDHWRVWVGMQGKFSRKISLQALVGYGNTYFKDMPEGSDGNLSGAQGFLGRIQAHWKPIKTQQFTLGFLRDYRHTYFTNYYVTTSPYLRYRGQIAGFLLPSADFMYGYREIGGEVARNDHELRARAQVDFQITKFFAVGVQYTMWSIIASDSESALFVDHMIGLGVDFGY